MTKYIFKAATKFHVQVFPLRSIITIRCEKETLVAWDREVPTNPKIISSLNVMTGHFAKHSSLFSWLPC